MTSRDALGRVSTDLRTRLGGHPAFSGLSATALDRLYAAVAPLNVRVGQVLCESQALPAQVLLILDGECRLLGLRQGRLSTMARLGPGSLVGLASLLRAAPCEAVTAAEPLTVAAIPDRLILELHQQEPTFRKWCASTLWPAELAALMHQLDNHVAWRTHPAESLQALLDQATVSFQSELVSIPRSHCRNPGRPWGCA